MPQMYSAICSMTIRVTEICIWILLRRIYKIEDYLKSEINHISFWVLNKEKIGARQPIIVTAPDSVNNYGDVASAAPGGCFYMTQPGTYKHQGTLHIRKSAEQEHSYRLRAFHVRTKTAFNSVRRFKTMPMKRGTNE